MRHEMLLDTYGKVDDKCVNCQHFITLQNNFSQHKCLKSIVNKSHRTNWRKNWLACGLFEKRKINIIKHNGEDPF